VGFELRTETYSHARIANKVHSDVCKSLGYIFLYKQVVRQLYYPFNLFILLSFKKIQILFREYIDILCVKFWQKNRFILSYRKRKIYYIRLNYVFSVSNLYFISQSTWYLKQNLFRTLLKYYILLHIFWLNFLRSRNLHFKNFRNELTGFV
jgi:hypothetical protein